MTTLQAKTTAAVEAVAARIGCEVVVESTSPNNGRWNFQSTNSFDTLLTITYHFQPGHNSFSAHREGERIVPGGTAPLWPRDRKNACMFIVSDPTDMNDMVAGIESYLKVTV